MRRAHEPRKSPRKRLVSLLPLAAAAAALAVAACAYEGQAMDEPLTRRATWFPSSAAVTSGMPANPDRPTATGWSTTAFGTSR